MKTMIQVTNNSGGTVNIVSQDYSMNIPYHSTKREWRKGWVKRWHIFGLHFYVSNTRLKKRQKRDLLYTGKVKNRCIENKRKLYERQGGKCPHCGQPFEYEQLEFHHVLPLSRFPELGQSIRNGIMLCHRCHKEIHCNPYKAIKIMEAKAKELGIDIKEKYDYGEEYSKQCENHAATTD